MDQKQVFEIFEKMVTLIGYEMALQIVNQAKPKEEVVVAKVEEKKAEEEKKRIPRMSPKISAHLKEIFGTDPTDEIKKGFIAYVNGLTEEEFTAKLGSNGLIDHMRDFANKVKSAETTVAVKTEEKPKKGRAKKKVEDKVTVVKTEEAVTTVKAKPKGSNAAGTIQLTLKELQDNINLVTTEYTKVGEYFNTETNQVVTGPDHSDDEWLDPVEFNGKTYMVSNRSGRVYEEGKGDGYDIFHGFVGVGQFSKMTMPRK